MCCLCPDCSLVQAGAVIQQASSAWTLKLDFSKKCTSFAETVISSIIVGMNIDGTLDTIYSKGIGGEMH